MSEAWAIQQGTTLSRILELRWPEDDPGGAYRRGDKITGTYAGTEARELLVWEGSDQAPEDVSSSSVTWHSAANGELKVTLDEADTAGWPVGRLYLQVYLTVGGKRLPVFPDDAPQPLDVVPAAGVAVDLPAYCSFADVVREAPWIRDVLGNDPTRHADLEDVRAQARKWLDMQLVTRARRILEYQGIAGGPVAHVTQPTPTAGVDAGPWRGPSVYPDETGRVQLAAIRGYLAANKLDAADGYPAKITALWTIAELCEREIGEGPGETSYQALANRFRGRALRMCGGWVARLDLGADATPRYLELDP